MRAILTAQTACTWKQESEKSRERDGFNPRMKFQHKHLARIRWLVPFFCGPVNPSHTPEMDAEAFGIWQHLFNPVFPASSSTETHTVFAREAQSNKLIRQGEGIIMYWLEEHKPTASITTAENEMHVAMKLHSKSVTNEAVMKANQDIFLVDLGDLPEVL